MLQYIVYTEVCLLHVLYMDVIVFWHSVILWHVYQLFSLINTTTTECWYNHIAVSVTYHLLLQNQFQFHLLECQIMRPLQQLLLPVPSSHPQVWVQDLHRFFLSLCGVLQLKQIKWQTTCTIIIIIYSVM